MRATTLLFVLALLPTPASATLKYAITDLGALPGHNASTAESINLLGQVAGTSRSNTFLSDRAFLWSNGQIQNLGTFGQSSTSGAYVNDQGLVAVNTVVPRTGGSYGNGRAVLYDPATGATTTFHALTPTAPTPSSVQ